MASCCSKVEECSKEEFCINKDDKIKNNCNYRLKLKAGINFFNKSKYVGSTFLEIEERLFVIGRRSGYGSYTYQLKPEEKEYLIDIFKTSSMKYAEKVDFKKCKNDIVSDSNRACCLIILTIGKIKYNIQNFNNRTVTEATAIKVRDYLRDKGFFVAIQYIGSKSNTLSLVKENNKVSKESIKTIKLVSSKQETPEMPGQVNMFELGIL